jgi:DNA-binding transcriptional regulator YiaG
MSNTQVKKIREQVQKREGLNITDAQDYCAATMGVIRRTWQRWESGERAIDKIYLQVAKEKLGKKQQSKK